MSGGTRVCFVFVVTTSLLSCSVALEWALPSSGLSAHQFGLSPPWRTHVMPPCVFGGLGGGGTVATERRSVILAAALHEDVGEVTVELVQNASAVRLLIPVSGASTRAAFKAAAAELAKNRVIPGWRAKDFAKIPAGVVASFVGQEAVKTKAIEVLADSLTPDAISELALSAIGHAKLLSTPEHLADGFTPGQAWQLCVQVDVWPDEPVWSVPFDKPFEVQIKRSKEDRRLREDALLALRERYATTQAVDRPAQPGDSCLVDIVAYFLASASGAKHDAAMTENAKDDNAEVALAKGDPVDAPVGGRDLDIVLHEGKFLPGVVEALIGCSPGAVVDVPITMPTKLKQQPRLAGKDLILEITLKVISERLLPTAEQLAANMNTTVASLERQIDDTLLAAQQQQQPQESQHDSVSVNEEIEKVLVERVAETHIPPDLVLEAAKRKFAVMLADMRSRGTADSDLKPMASPQGFEKYRRIVQPTIEREILAKLAIRHIAKCQGVRVDPSEVNEQLQLIRAQYKDSNLNEQQASQRVLEELTRLKVLEYLRESVAIIKVTTVESSSS